MDYYTYNEASHNDDTLIFDVEIKSAVEINPSNFQTPTYAVTADADLPKSKKGEVLIVEFEGEPINLTVSNNVKAVKDWRKINVWNKKTAEEKEWDKVLLDDDYTDIEPKINFCRFDGKKWVYDESLLEEAKLDKRNEINDKHTKVLNAGFEFNDLLFDSDRDSILYINSSVATARIAIDEEKPFNVIWTLKDNSSVELDAQAIFDVQKNLDAHINSAHAKSAEFKSMIESAKTIADVIKIKWVD